MMQGQCKDCGCICVLDKMWERYGCPACRAARVVEAFRPIDPLRTAQGILAGADLEDLRDAMGKPCSWNGERTVGFGGHGEEKVYDDISQTEVPRGCRMPQGDD